MSIESMQDEIAKRTEQGIKQYELLKRTKSGQVSFCLAWLMSSTRDLTLQIGMPPAAVTARVQRYGWTILEPSYLVPVIQVGALTRTPTREQAREMLHRQQYEFGYNEITPREVEHLEWFIAGARSKDYWRGVEIDFWLSYDLLPWSKDSWGVGDLS